LRLRLLFYVTFSAALLLGSLRAAAHNSAHAALAVLGWDEQGASILQLTRGLAYRSEDGFRYVCPEVWGGDINAPASAIPGGPAVVAAEQLYLVEANGQISVHPNHQGKGIALARNGDALFGLFASEDRVELRRITRSASELLQSFDESFGLLVASDSALTVLQVSGQQLVLQRLSLTGALGERVSWGEPSKIVSAALRASGDQVFVTLVHSTAPWLTLGRIRDGRYEPLRSASSAFAGPLTLAGETLVVRDGTLELLDGSRALSQASYVECLEAFDDVHYACVGDGLTEVGGDGLGKSLFDMVSLREPDLEELSETQRSDCSARWRDLRTHLVLEGRVAAEPREQDAGEDNGADAGAGETVPMAAAACALGRGAGKLSGLSALLLLSVMLSARRAGVAARRRKCYSASES